jgi:hypothetical protein
MGLVAAAVNSVKQLPEVLEGKDRRGINFISMSSRAPYIFQLWENYYEEPDLKAS